MYHQIGYHVHADDTYINKRGGIRHCMTWHWDIFVNWLCRMCQVEF